MEKRDSEHSKDVLERIIVCVKSSRIISNLVFFSFKCQMTSFSSSNVWVVLPISMFMILFPFSSHGRCLAYIGPCVPFAPDLLCPRLLMNFFAVSCIFDFYGILYFCTSIIWVILNKTVKKINRRSVPHFHEHCWDNQIAWSQEKLSHYKLQGRYLITRFQFS